jgi:ABC-type uncharacterized transport system permease subunit
MSRISPLSLFSLHFEARAEPSKMMMWLSPVVAVVLTMAFGMLLFALLGKDPLRGLQVFLLEPMRDWRALSELGLKAAPLALCAAGLAVCYRSNVWNIGAEGQLIAGAILGGAIGLYLDGSAIPKFIAISLMVLGGIVGGMAWAAITALLRDKFLASEILVSLMLTYVAQLLLSYLVHGALRDPNGFNFPQSKLFSDQILLPILFEKTRLHLGFVFALLALLAAYLYLFKSFAGFKQQVGGMSPMAARFAGFSSRTALWWALLISGACAGLAGLGEAAGPVGQLNSNISPGYGFAAIIVAFVGRLHPIGIVFSSFIMALIYIGGELSQSRLGLPSAITGVFQGLLLFFILMCDVLVNYKLKLNFK